MILCQSTKRQHTSYIDFKLYQRLENNHMKSHLVTSTHFWFTDYDFLTTHLLLYHLIFSPFSMTKQVFRDP